MPKINVTVTETIDMPEGTLAVLAPTGVLAGFRLPDGNFLKPWLTFEHYLPGKENQDPEGDIDYDALLELNVEIGLDIQRQFDPVEGEIITEVRQVGLD